MFYPTVECPPHNTYIMNEKCLVYVYFYTKYIFDNKTVAHVETRYIIHLI